MKETKSSAKLPSHFPGSFPVPRIGSREGFGSARTSAKLLAKGNCYHLSSTSTRFNTYFIIPFPPTESNDFHFSSPLFVRCKAHLQQPQLYGHGSTISSSSVTFFAQFECAPLICASYGEVSPLHCLYLQRSTQSRQIGSRFFERSIMGAQVSR